MRLKKLLLFLLFLLMVAAVIEGAAYLVGSYLNKQRGVLYTPQMLEGYSQYLETRDENLGWPAASAFGKGDYDKTGSRIIPAFPDQTDACVSLYGDSFTWSSEVDQDQSWSNVLSKLLNCRVANYGVVGYGTDQAYLRSRHNSRDEADVVILAHFSAGIIRNVSQFRTLTTGILSFDLKPRFIVDDQGQLSLIPLPQLSSEAYKGMVEDPALYLKHDYFVPGGESGLRYFRFPYTWSVLTSIGHERMQANILGKPWYADFYQPDHPSQSLEITAKIIQQFHADALESGRKPVVIIMPTRKDLVIYDVEARWVYQNLIDSLDEAGIEVLNIGLGMHHYLKGRDACELFAAQNCSGHYNGEGYRLVANLVYEYLLSRDLVPNSHAVVD